VKLLGEFFVTGQAAIVHCQFLANATNGEFGGAGQSEHQLVCGELFQFPDGMDPEEVKGVPCFRITLEDDIQRRVDGNSGATEFAGIAGFPETGSQSRFANTFSWGVQRQCVN